MRRQNESFGELLFKAPWWVSAAIGVLAFIALRWDTPAWAGNDNLRQTFAKGIAPFAPLPLIFLASSPVVRSGSANTTAAWLTSRPLWSHFAPHRGSSLSF
ncbi:MAG TPA: hypothetical protein VHG89_10965 [Verrucomicrobiae bacterium]|nr:hypothetical protein [Verrucomicrobiae bacterium]